MIKLLLSFLLIFVVCSLSIATITATTNNYINTIITPYDGNNTILIVNPFATNGDYIVESVTLEYSNKTDSILDILSFDQVDKNILIYGNNEEYDSLILIDYRTGSFKVISEVDDILSYSWTPQKLIFINDVTYLPVYDNLYDNQNVQILVTNFNDKTAKYVELNTPSFSFFIDQNLIQGYDPINNKLYIGYGTDDNGVYLIEVSLIDNNGDSGSASASPNQIIYDNIQGFTRFEYIFTDNSGQVYIVSRDSQFNIVICKFDKDSKDCPKN